MSKTKRSAESNYSVMKDQDIIDLDVENIVTNDAFLVLWVPGSKLDVGIECCNKWGFKPIQTWVWVKIKKEPLKKLKSDVIKNIVNLKSLNISEIKKEISVLINDFDLNESLNFFMGHSFRQTHEIAIIGGRGSYTNLLKNKSQRSVFIGTVKDKHSEKPEALHDRLDIMFPNAHKLEMFARKNRPGWTCLGNDSEISLGEDIRESIEKIKKLESISLPGTNNATYTYHDQRVFKLWKDIPNK